MAVPIVQWLAVHPELGWTLLGLICASMLLWPLAPQERRRIVFVWALSVAALVLWLTAGLPSPEESRSSVIRLLPVLCPPEVTFDSIQPISREDWRLLTLEFYAKFIAIADHL